MNGETMQLCDKCGDWFDYDTLRNHPDCKGMFCPDCMERIDNEIHEEAETQRIVRALLEGADLEKALGLDEER